MQVIYKYPVSDQMPTTCVEAPIIKPLQVAYQNGRPFLWAVIDTDLYPVKRCIVRMPTGHGFVSHHALGEYLNTTVSPDESLVWHWFYRIPIEHHD